MSRKVSRYDKALISYASGALIGLLDVLGCADHKHPIRLSNTDFHEPCYIVSQSEIPLIKGDVNTVVD